MRLRAAANPRDPAIVAPVTANAEPTPLSLAEAETDAPKTSAEKKPKRKKDRASSISSKGSASSTGKKRKNARAQSVPAKLSGDVPTAPTSHASITETGNWGELERASMLKRFQEMEEKIFNTAAPRQAPAQAEEQTPTIAPPKEPSPREPFVQAANAPNWTPADYDTTAVVTDLPLLDADWQESASEP